MDPVTSEPKKWITPSTLCISLLLFFLPWINVTCNGKTLIRQTGLQAAMGEASFAPDLEQMMGKDKVAKKDDKDAAGKAILLFPVLGCLVVGILLGFVAKKRLPGVICATVAFGLLSAQFAIGYPVDKQIQAENAKAAAQKDAMQKDAPAGAPPGLGMPPGLDNLMVMQVNYTPFFWVSYLITLVPLIAFLVFPSGKPVSKKRPSSSMDPDQFE